MNLIAKFCQFYMIRLQKKAKGIQKQIQDKKLEEAGDKLKALYEFVKFINEKCLKNRHERKSFWRNVSEGHPLVENTILDMIRKRGVKEESIKAISEAKFKAQEQAKLAEAKRKAQSVNVKTCPTDCPEDCGKCVNRPVSSEALKSDEVKN